MLVSVAIFSIVLLVAMGAILTILDANRKARTLTEVMNNLNFSFESVTRSIKTGTEPRIENGDELTVTAINLAADDFTRQTIAYRHNTTESGRGVIERSVGGGTWQPITSELVDITNFQAAVHGGNVAFSQPRTVITVSGEVRASNDIRSSFDIQTTISQRKLNLENDEGSI